MTFKKIYEEKKMLIDNALEELSPSKNKYPEIIHEALRYSLFAGGKRLRPILSLASSEAINRNNKDIIPFACSLELIHTYSLIHDDLPALDDDDYRRGKLSNHKKFGEDIAILAGDALLTLAFEILSNDKYIKHFEAKKVLKVINEIANAIGTDGMIGGQIIDLESEGSVINKETLDYIHTKKTGSLITVSLRVGAILSGSSEEELEMLTNYGKSIGLLYQVTDDILDLTGDQELIGKPINSDLENKKATYPFLYGLDNSKKIAKNLSEEALTYLDIFGENANFLKDFTSYLIERDS